MFWPVKAFLVFTQLLGFNSHKMALFRYGFTVQNNSQSDSVNCDTVPSIPASFLSQENTSLGTVEYQNVLSVVGTLVDDNDGEKSSSARARNRGNYNHYSPEIRAKIGKYASENGNSKALKKFKAEVPNLKESTVRSFKQAYERKLKEVTKKRNVEAQVLAIPSDTRGRPPILLELDAKLISLLKSIRSRGGVINFSVVKATALALVKSNPSSSVTGFQPTTTWVRSVYRRCGFSRRAGTTNRPPVPRGLFEECKLMFLSDINKTINEHKIPPELVLNADQTPCLYVSVGKMTMAPGNSSSVPIKGLTDKRSITLTYVISLSGNFLLMQVIYQGKTTASQPRNF